MMSSLLFFKYPPFQFRTIILDFCLSIQLLVFFALFIYYFNKCNQEAYRYQDTGQAGAEPGTDQVEVVPGTDQEGEEPGTGQVGAEPGTAAGRRIAGWGLQGKSSQEGKALGVALQAGMAAAAAAVQMSRSQQQQEQNRPSYAYRRYHQ